MLDLSYLKQPDWPALYAEHVASQQTRYEQALSQAGLESLLIADGDPQYYYQDDIQKPFRAAAHFLSWLPLTAHPGCYLWIKPGHKPVLFYVQQADFWHQPPASPSGFWAEHFDIVPVRSKAEISQQIAASSAHMGFVGENLEQASNWGIAQVNPDALLAQLNWHRAYKTPYEQACMQAASNLAVQGHRAAEQAFLAGESEYGIHLAYLSACQHLDAELPYPNIIGVNEHAAILHYQNRRREPVAVQRSLLIDAGANYQGYGADITRTYTADKNLFADLIEGVDGLQQRLIEQIQPGLDYAQLHEQACLQIAELLQQLGIVKLGAEQQLEQGIVTQFFPHGLGHLLGLQVHDVGGHQANVQGDMKLAPEQHPFLRLTRQIEPNMVFTIEPGVYFIPALLAPLRQSNAAQYVDWKVVDELSAYGGVRVEDDVLLTEQGVVNLTRNAFAELS